MKLKKEADIKCRNLVLAAGPFTTWIFDDLFTTQQLGLDNYVQRGHWLHVRSKTFLSNEEIALRFPNAADTIPRFEKEITMVPRIGDKEIAVSAMEEQVIRRSLDANHACTDKLGKSSKLVPVLAKYVDRDVVSIDEERILHRGCSVISTANDQNPIIDKVPTSGLGRNCSEEEDRNPCGVWLCYGFGRHGTMLAPGAACMLVSMIVKGRREANCFDFTVPVYAKPKQDGLEGGKGKGKAKI